MENLLQSTSMKFRRSTSEVEDVTTDNFFGNFKESSSNSVSLLNNVQVTKILVIQKNWTELRHFSKIN